MKEKKKNVEIIDPEYSLNKIGRAVAKGKCGSCGGVVFRLLKAEEIPASLAAKMKSKKGGARKSKASRPSAGRKSKPSRKSKKSKKSKKSRKSKRSIRRD